MSLGSSRSGCRERKPNLSNLWFDGFHYDNRFYYTAVIEACDLIIKSSVSEYTKNRGELKGLLDVIRYTSSDITLGDVFVASDYLVKVFSVDVCKLLRNPLDRSVSNKEYVRQCISDIGSSNVVDARLTDAHNINRVVLQLHVHRNSLIRTVGPSWNLHILRRQPNVTFDC